MYSLHNVRYKGILHIDKLNIAASTVTSIVGESGSGKTTLLKLLNKMICCDSGEITYNNIPLYSINSIELRRKVIMLSQSPAIYPGTIRDNLLIGLKFSEKPPMGDNTLINTLLSVNLNKILDENADNLSGGEKQRLALGRILLLEPEVFLLDEPSSALDEETEHIIIGKLVEFTKENKKTLIMVTHSKKVAQDFSDNIIEIKNGRIINSQGV